MEEEAPAGGHFSARRRTAVVLAAEGVGLAYLSGVVRALGAAGVRMDLVIGRGAGAVVAAFAAVDGNRRLHEEGGLVGTIAKRRPFRLRPFHRISLACLALAFAFFLAPALVGAISIVALPVRAVIAWLVPGAEPASELLATLYAGLETYYLPAIALPVILLFLLVALRWLSRTISERRLASPLGALGLVEEDAPLAPAVELAPLAQSLEAQLWQVVRGASTDARPRTREALGEAYRALLEASLGQHGFSELVLYALDTDSGREVPFVALKERYQRTLVARRAGADAAEPVDLCGDGAPLLLDALVASVSPLGLVPTVPVKLPLGARFGGEVHRFASSLFVGRDAVADAVACGAEQILYVTATGASGSVTGSTFERVSQAALRRSFEDDLSWAAASGVPVFVIQPEAERLRPFELQGRRQLGGERFSPLALVAEGERDALRQFIHPVLGEEIPTFPSGSSRAHAEATVPVVREEWEAGPDEL